MHSQHFSFHHSAQCKAFPFSWLLEILYFASGLFLFWPPSFLQCLKLELHDSLFIGLPCSWIVPSKLDSISDQTTVLRIQPVIKSWVSSTWVVYDVHMHIFLMTVRMLREELQLLQEPGSYVGEVVKVMGKSKVLVKVSGIFFVFFLIGKLLYLAWRYSFIIFVFFSSLIIIFFLTAVIIPLFITFLPYYFPLLLFGNLLFLSTWKGPLHCNPTPLPPELGLKGLWFSTI